MNKLLSFLCIVFILYFARTMLLPLIMAVLLWYLANMLTAYYKKILGSRIAAGVLSALSFAGIMYLFVSQIQPMFGEIYAKIPDITAGINKTLASLSDLIGTEISFADSNFPSVQGILTGIGSSLMDFSRAFGMIVVYMMFIFWEQRTFPKKLKALFPGKREFGKVSFIVHSIDTHMRKYIAVKTWVSFLQGVSSWLLFWALGIDFAGVFGFIVFMLNYIPTIGSIIAAALPAIYVFAMTGSLSVPLISLIGSVIINFVFGNILDTQLMGKALNLSTMAILINLVFWGAIWGPIGMFFSVPILMMIFIACAQFDKTRGIAVLLSADGNIPDKIEE